MHQSRGHTDALFQYFSRNIAIMHRYPTGLATLVLYQGTIACHAYTYYYYVWQFELKLITPIRRIIYDVFVWAKTKGPFTQIPSFEGPSARILQGSFKNCHLQYFYIAISIYISVKLCEQIIIIWKHKYLSLRFN